MYWAQALAEQSEDEELKAVFTSIAQQLTDNETVILKELLEVQGTSVDIGGYYHSDPAMTESVMRPIHTLNQVID